jgi:SAM-dependent methyltransferase
LKKAFDGWMKELPRGGYVLDAGCGHGVPVITRLLKKGFQVTGSDFSPAMLESARKKFPRVSFRERAITDIEEESIFDGVCSFSSILYLDTIDLFNSIYRLYRALKPGGRLFLFGYDLHPTWRGVPLHEDLNHWMWGGTFSKEEISNALEEHGYFKVTKAEDVDTEKEREKRVEQVRLSEQKEYERLMGHFPSLNHMVEKIQSAEGMHLLEGFHLPENLSQLLPANIPINSGRVAYPYVVIAEKNGRQDVPRE